MWTHHFAALMGAGPIGYAERLDTDICKPESLQFSHRPFTRPLFGGRSGQAGADLRGEVLNKFEPDTVSSTRLYQPLCCGLLIH